MSDASPKRWFRFRFSLRLLLAAVTLFCAFLAYQIHWIHQRHAFLSEQWRRHEQMVTKANGVPEDWYKFWTFRQRQGSEAPGPALLWLFGEPGVGELLLVVPEKDIWSHHQISWISFWQTDFQEAKRLFPEAYVCPINHYQIGSWTAVQIGD